VAAGHGVDPDRRSGRKTREANDLLASDDFYGIGIRVDSGKVLGRWRRRDARLGRLSGCPGQRRKPGG